MIITIDTEEDNWGNYTPKNYTLENISKIPELQDLFDEFDVLPTYLVTHSVAADARSTFILRQIFEQGRCEIGMHCHPWHTPPFEEESTERNSMLCNLPANLLFRKIERLHETIVKSFNTAPVSFRAGRWGYGKEVARSLCKLGYKVDSSILSLIDWTDYFEPDFSQVFSEPFRFDPVDILRPNAMGALLEVPATVGFSQSSFIFCNDLYNDSQSQF